MDSVVLKEMKLTPPDVLSDGALDTKLNELQKKARRDREEWARKNAELNEELKAAEERTARLEADM